ncbi:cysteine dioxygenase [Erwinia sp. 198]|uniref:cysteine dioxygenase family protein n=1 Tax=Erwinia sp. 198 TaxID=2022746 RepID=UPI000F68460F|nr:cysteine dioxygenase [Erwinia sp. 198]RRZ87036.1 cysteine dioxygenase [Erwinia sp. 198]
MSNLQHHRLRAFVGDLAALLDSRPSEQHVLQEGSELLKQLIRHDDWLPEPFAQPDPQRYQQYLLYADAQQRFSVVSFVWGAGQSTPVHDHRVWGLIGMLRGAEVAQHFRRDEQGALWPEGEPVRLNAGDVEAVSPEVGDIHCVSNAFIDRPSISIHVYGGNIGAVKRAVYDEDGCEKPFISGYNNAFLPNIWDLSHG